MLKNPIFFFLLCIFTVLNIADAITAFFILDAESNILFLFGGSIWLPYLLKVIIIGALWFIYNKNTYPSHFIYYVIMMIMVLGSVAIAFGVFSNVMGMLNEHIVTDGKDLSTSEKAKYYGSIISILYIIPMAFSLLAFKLYEWSVKYINIKNNKNKIIQ